MLGNVTLILVCRPDLPVADPSRAGGAAARQARRLLLWLAGHRHGTPLADRGSSCRAGRSAPCMLPYLGSVKAVVDLAERAHRFHVPRCHRGAGADRRGQDQGAGRHRAAAARPCCPPFRRCPSPFRASTCSPGCRSRRRPGRTPAAILGRLNSEINVALPGSGLHAASAARLALSRSH